MVLATLLLVALQVPEQGDAYRGYRRCLRDAAIDDPVEPTSPPVVAVAQAVRKCAPEREKLLDIMVAYHVHIDKDYGEPRANRALAKFEAGLVEKYSNSAYEIPVADYRGVFLGE